MEELNNNIAILETDVGGIKLKELNGISFYSWVSSRLNNLPAYDHDVVELTNLVTQGTFIGRVPDERKVEIAKKLIRLGAFKIK